MPGSGAVLGREQRCVPMRAGIVTAGRFSHATARTRSPPLSATPPLASVRRDARNAAEGPGRVPPAGQLAHMPTVRTGRTASAYRFELVTDDLGSASVAGGVSPGGAVRPALPACAGSRAGGPPARARGGGRAPA